MLNKVFLARVASIQRSDADLCRLSNQRNGGIWAVNRQHQARRIQHSHVVSSGLSLASAACTPWSVVHGPAPVLSQCDAAD